MKKLKKNIICLLGGVMGNNDINANNIDANNISYYAVYFAYENIKCKSITGIRENHKHFVLDGTLEIENENNVEGDK